MSELLLLGISHKTAPVERRERLALTEEGAKQLLAELIATEPIAEAVAISTCNRTEIFVVSPDPVAAETELLGRLAAHAAIRPTELADTMYSPRNCDAARHLFRVTSGLESMIVGEAEVQGQVKRAYDAALEAGTTGPLTNRVFTAALQTGKRVRSETALGASRLSVSSVAVELCHEVVGHLPERKILIIGAGETAELTAQALAGEGVTTIFVANRHAARARSIAERFGGHVCSLEEMPELLASADIVLTSTSSPHAIIGVEALTEVVEVRGGRDLVMVDMAVPRDIEAACGELPGVTLYDIDDLQAVVARNLQVREAERSAAEGIVEDEIRRFAKWLGQLDVLPTIGALREHGAAIAEQVLAENTGRWESASPADRARVEAMAKAIVQRLLHEPTIRMKSMEHGRLQLARELFGLEEGTAAEHEADAEVRPLRRRRKSP